MSDDEPIDRDEELTAQLFALAGYLRTSLERLSYLEQEVLRMAAILRKIDPDYLNHYEQSLASLGETPAQRKRTLELLDELIVVIQPTDSR